MSWCNCDCGLMIGAISALAGIVVTVFVGVNIWQYLKIERKLKEISDNQIRTDGFVQLIESYKHEYNDNRELALDAAYIALGNFKILNENAHFQNTLKRIKELINGRELNSFSEMRKRIKDIDDKLNNCINVNSK